MPASKSKSTKSENKEVTLLKAMQKHMQPAHPKKRIAKSVERWEEDTSVSHQPVQFTIPKGKGKKLSDCPHIHHALTKTPSHDKKMVALHSWALGRPLKRTPVKKNLEQFSGVKFSGTHTREKLVEKIKTGRKETLVAVLKLLGQKPGSAEKAELADQMVTWLEKPHDADAEIHVAKKSSSSSRSRSASPARKSKKAKKDPNAPKKPRSAYIFFTSDKRGDYLKKHPSASVTDVSKALGKKWNSLSDKDKKPYADKAEKDKKRYHKEMEKYNK